MQWREVEGVKSGTLFVSELSLSVTANCGANLAYESLLRH